MVLDVNNDDDKISKSRWLDEGLLSGYHKKKNALNRQIYECCTNKISAHIEYGDIHKVTKLWRRCGNLKIILYNVWVNGFN